MSIWVVRLWLLLAPAVVLAQQAVVTPGDLFFHFMAGQLPPGPQRLTVTSPSGNSVSFSAQAAVLSPAGGKWLQITTDAGFVYAAVNTAGLPPGTYTGRITVTPTAPLTAVEVPVTLAVTNALVPMFSPGSLNFAYEVGGELPGAQVLSPVGGIVAPARAISSHPAWLKVSAQSDENTGGVSVSVDPAGLAAGTHRGAVTVVRNTSAQVVQVTLAVAATAVVNPSPRTLTLSAQPGSANPASQVVSIAGQAGTPFTAYSSAAWLSISSGSGAVPATLTVTASAAALPAGTYNGTVSVASGNFVVPVTVTFVVALPVTVTPASLAMSAPAGSSTPVSQTLSITSTAGQFSYSGLVVEGGGWLQVFGSGYTPGTLTVQANPTGLGQASYSGKIAVVVSAGGMSSQTEVPVTFAVGTQSSSGLTATPQSLTFSQAVNGAAPAAQSLTISGPDGSSFLAVAHSSSDWITATPITGPVPNTVTVSVNGSGLAAGTYSGDVTIKLWESIASVKVPVTLYVGSTPPSTTLTAAPAAMSLAYTIGGAAPTGSLSVSSSPNGVSFTASASSAGNWLSLSAAGGTAPATLTLSIATAGLTAGTHTGNVVLTPPSGTAVTVPVTLQVSAASSPASLTATPASIALEYTIGGAAPSRTLAVGGATAGTGFSASASSTGNWLSVTPSSGSTPASLTVSIATAGLSVGSYNGSVVLTPAGGFPLTVPVTLQVGAAPGPGPFAAAPASLSLQYTIGGAAPSGTLAVSSAAAVSFSATPSSAANWLAVAPAGGTTPASLSVSVNAAGLTAGNYTGIITLTPSSGAAVTVPVNLAVSAGSTGPGLTATPSILSFQYRTGDPDPLPQTVDVSAPGAFGIAVASTGWLSVSPASGSGSGRLAVAVAPRNLSAGSYTGLVTLTAAGATPVRVEVALTVRLPATGPSVTSVEPASLAFDHRPGDAAPPAQIIRVSATGDPVPLEIKAASAGWLSVAPGSAGTPALVAVSVDPRNLAAGTHTGLVVVVAGGSQGAVHSIPVSLTIADGPSVLELSRSAVSMSAAAGDTAGHTAMVDVDSTGGPLAFSAVAYGAGWLSVMASGNITPATLIVSAQPAGLSPGTYSGLIAVEGPGAQAPLTVLVNLVVSPRLATVTGVLNSASRSPGPIAPGEIVEIVGRSLGPSQPVSSGGAPVRALGGVRVLFNGYPATLMQVGEERVTAIVPYEVEAQAKGWVKVENGANQSNSFALEIREASPALFTADGSGTGPSAALNADARLNSAEDPAVKGSIISLYATGEGRTDPPGDCGAINPMEAPRPLLPVSVTIGGFAADVLYAGGVPGSLPGLFQVNVRVPEQTASGAAEVILTVGEMRSPEGVTAAIR